MYYKRLKTYKSIGYLIKDDIKEKQYANYIYDSSNYTNVFEKDINEANESIIISSPSINEEKVYRFIDLIKDRQETSQVERNDILEILEIRNNRKSTIFASQFSPEGWHNKLGSGPVADAILDRIINSSYHILLQGKSLRETYSKIKE